MLDSTVYFLYINPDRMKPMIISIIIPCLNEEKGISKCIKALSKVKSLKLKVKSKIEILVVDNGSTDNSAKVAKKAGARVVKELKKGYGFALRRGIAEAKGEIIVMGDGDGSYDFAESGKLIDKVLSGSDLVLGSRFLGKMEKGAMPFLHQHIGTPVLNFFFRIFFGIKLSDSQSGFRAFKKKTTGSLPFKTGGMEFASEMLFATSRAGYKIEEIPVSYLPRIGKSKLSPLRDAWRHIKFLLLFSPSYLFVLPGIILFVSGMGMVAILSFGSFRIFTRALDVHSMLVFSFAAILGFQIIFLGLFAKTYAFLFLKEKDRFYQKLLSGFTLERGLFLGGVFFLIGIVIFAYVFTLWARGGFGALSEVRLLILSMTILILGVQGIFSSFFFALMGSGESKN